MFDTNIVTQLSPDVLRTFVAAADAGSFTHAAASVHRTQSAVSMQMKRLESELSRTLFDRRGRGVVLTAEGDTLYRYARRLLALHDEALSAITAPRLGGKVRFGAPEDYAVRFLPQALKRFAAVHPMVEVEVLCDGTPNLQKRFADGGLDVMLTTEDTWEGPGRRQIDLVWVVAEHGGPLDQSPLPLALFHAGCLYRRNALLSLEKAGIAYRIAYGSPSMAGVLAAVRAGLAVAPATETSIASGCRRATLEDGLPPIAPVGIGLHLAPGNASEAVASLHAFMGHELGLAD
jgi:DNA-binding transcriptional LysR family regulator